MIYIKILKIDQFIIIIIFTISNFKISQFRPNVMWHDAYCQQHNEILKIKFIFNYQMLYPNIDEMNDSIYSKSKPWLHLVNIWNDDINNEVNDSHPTIPITNTINIEHYDLQSNFVIRSRNVLNKKSQILEDENSTKSSYDDEIIWIL
jgi:hypothetical protein